MRNTYPWELRNAAAWETMPTESANQEKCIVEDVAGATQLEGIMPKMDLEYLSKLDYITAGNFISYSKILLVNMVIEGVLTMEEIEAVLLKGRNNDLPRYPS